MVTGNPRPLTVDPEQLSAAGGALRSSAENLPEPPPPFLPVGADPLSAAIIGQIPAVETPVMTQLPLIQAQATTTAQNVIDSAMAYQATDQRSGAAINEMLQTPPTVPGSPGSGGPPPSAAGGGAASMGQMMSMPAQMAGQMTQMPMQVMGAMAAVPQGVMQGAQQAGQQVQQMVGQFGQGGTGSQGSGADGAAIPAVEVPQAQSSDAPGEDDGAAAGRPEEERAPDAKGDSDETGSSATAPGRHRADESDAETNL